MDVFIFVINVLFILYLVAKKFKSNQKCKEEDQMEKDVGKQLILNTCMEKCLLLDPPALIFSYGKGDSCGAAGRCRCFCYQKPRYLGSAGKCEASSNHNFDIFKVEFEGKLTFDI